jgi:PAS domain S-box-containing protein
MLFFRLKKTKVEFQERLQLAEQAREHLAARFLSEIENLENRLSESEKLARVTRQSENAIMLMDAQGNIFWTNDSFSRMYEYSFSEFTSRLGDNILKTSFSGMIHERLQKVYTTKKPVSYDAPNITKTGKEIWTRTSLIPLLDDNNEICGLVTVDSDIHRRVKAGEKLIDYIRDFNQKTEAISEQLNVMVELTDALFERIDISQRRIDRTDQIIDFIKGISDQTKILGINASIEAYSAGEHGKGFRVIANEIVHVSNVTLNSLKEIYELIHKIQSSSDKLTTVRERSETAIGNHRSLVDELKKDINEVEQTLMQMN